jgi:hypothetical protein
MPLLFLLRKYYNCKVDHVAILKPNWKLLPKLLNGEKTIETRWYLHKFAPWNQVKANDTIYFKDSG